MSVEGGIDQHVRCLLVFPKGLMGNYKPFSGRVGSDVLAEPSDWNFLEALNEVE